MYLLAPVLVNVIVIIVVILDPNFKWFSRKGCWRNFIHYIVDMDCSDDIFSEILSKMKNNNIMR